MPQLKSSNIQLIRPLKPITSAELDEFGIRPEPETQKANDKKSTVGKVEKMDNAEEINFF